MDDAHPLVAVDAGGSGVRARLYRAGVAVGPIVALDAPANLLRGPAALQAIAAVVARAAAAGGASEAPPRVSVGAAGATPAGRAALLAAPPRCTSLRLITDGLAATLGAHGGADGGVAILGTGASATLWLGGVATEIGGWGFAVDDLGSGADIGRRALRAVLRAADDAAAPGMLARLVGRLWPGGPVELAERAQAATPRDFAALAPAAFDAASAGDASAQAIIGEAAAELARLIALLKDRGAPRVSVAGSIALRLAPRLTAAAALAEPFGDALDGAVIAERLGLGWVARREGVEA